MQISEQICAVLDDLAQRFGVVIDWGQENVIPYIQQLCDKYIKYKITTSIVWICFGVALIVVGYVLFISGHKWDKSHKYDSGYLGIGKSVFIIAATFCWIISTGIVISQTFDIIRCCMFPELQVFEFVNSMITKMK